MQWGHPSHPCKWMVSIGKPNQMNSTESNVEKPNPYVQVIKKDDEHIFKYPKSKIFVGGLDFKL